MILQHVISFLHKIITGPIPARVVNSLSFYGGWTALVVFAAEGAPGKGLLVLLAILLVHFALSRQKVKDLIFLTTVAAAGCLIDTALLTTGVLVYASPNPYWPWASPFWMIGVYLLCAAAVDYSLFWLRKNLPMAALLGGMGGITSYLAGAKLGAAQFLLPGVWSLVVIGIVWFFFMPATCWFSEWLDRSLATD